MKVLVFATPTICLLKSIDPSLIQRVETLLAFASTASLSILISFVEVFF